MLYLDRFEFDYPKLLIIYLGGSFENCNVEMHDAIFIAAKNDAEATQKIKKKWQGKSVHVDSWFAAEQIEGFAIRLSKERMESSPVHLYFVNLGFYQAGVFGESHFMTLVVTASKSKAVEEAKKKLPPQEMLHSDNVYDLDDCIQIDEVDNYFIQLERNGLQQNIKPINGYQKLRPTSDYSDTSFSSGHSSRYR